MSGGKVFFHINYRAIVYKYLKAMTIFFIDYHKHEKIISALPLKMALP